MQFTDSLHCLALAHFLHLSSVGGSSSDGSPGTLRKILGICHFGEKNENVDF